MKLSGTGAATPGRGAPATPPATGNGHTVSPDAARRKAEELCNLLKVQAAVLATKAPVVAPTADSSMYRLVLGELREVLVQLMRHNEALAKVVIERPMVEIDRQTPGYAALSHGSGRPPSPSFPTEPPPEAAEIPSSMPADAVTYSSAAVLGGPPHGAPAAVEDATKPPPSGAAAP